MVTASITIVLVLAAAFGMAYWANRARTDRSANVGLYLLFGIPGVLLIVAGAAFAVSGSRDGITFLAMGLGLTLPLVKRVRQAVASFTPMDPGSPIDMSGLSMLLFVIGVLAVAYFAQPEPSANIEPVTLSQLLVQVVAFVALAFILVGTFVYRTPRQAIERLGLRRLSPAAVGVALAAVLAALFLSGLASAATKWLQPDLFDKLERVTNDMTADVQNPAGALALGLSAGIGEELLLRGAIQPRFGIFLTSLFFALLHVQYGMTFVLVGLFGISVMLGVLRDRYGTGASIVTHAVFNTIVVLAQISR